MRQKHFLIAFLAMLLCFASPAFAQVAKVGNTEYATIDEAIANWTNGSTLTLLSDVTLSKVIELSSTEHHILDLGTYTMTAASKKDAIQIVNNGRSSASYALDIKADATNPGGITASGKAVVKTTGKSGVKDRPIIRFYNGVFTGTNVVYHSGSNGTNCPQFWFYGGTFNGTIYANRALFQFYGGTFNGYLQISVDSSAYALISGGRFKYLSNQYGSALNSDKFTIGSAKGNYNRGIYVDKDGYYVITSEVITKVTAKYPAVKKESYSSNNYFNYSAAATYGMFYEKASMAGTGSNVTLFEKVQAPAVDEIVKPEATEEEKAVVEEVIKDITNNQAIEDYTVELPADVNNFTIEVEAIEVEEGTTPEAPETTTTVVTEIAFTVTPTGADGNKVSAPSEAITFRLPLPANWASNEVKVRHNGTDLGKYTVKTENNAKYVEVVSQAFSTYTVQAVIPVAKIGETTYETLAAAISGATAGQTITLMANVNENVTIKKNLTIDGAGKIYTGNITATNKVDVAIKNINFDGQGYNGYAIDMKGAYNITIEDCTVKNYGYGFLQNASSSINTIVKNVTIEGVNYGIKVDYANAVSLENVKMTNVKYGILNSNYGAKTITIKNSELTTLNIWERNQTTYTTFKFEGKNTIASLPTSTLVKYEGVIVGNTAYGELTDALADVKADDVLNIHSNYTLDKSINVTGNLTIYGNGKTLTYTGSGASARAITVESTANGANLTVNNLTIDCTASYCQRGINYNTNGTLTLNGVTVKGQNVTYALNLPGSSDNATVAIKNSTLSGNIALNVWGENATITAENTVFTSVDNNTAEGYAAVKLNNDGETAAEGSVINITGGKIEVTGTACTDTEAASNATATGEIKISESTIVNGEVATMVAVIRYDNGTSYSFTKIEDAIAKANAGETITLLRDITASEIVTINKAITLDGNGKTLKSTAARAINVDAADGATIKNLTINATGERAINVINGATNVTVEKVTATAANYTVNLAASAAGAKVTINSSNLTGLNVVNVAAKNTEVIVNGGTLTCNDQNASECYAAIALNTNAENAKVVVTNSTFEIKGDSRIASNGAVGATITIDGVEYGEKVVAIIEYEGTDNYYSFYTIEDAIAKAMAGETVKLVADATGAGVVIDKNITIDFNGKTYSFNEGVGSTGTKSNGFQILKGNTVTLKNGTLNVAADAADKFYILVQNYANLTVENMKLDGTNLDKWSKVETDQDSYVLSNNSGNVVVTGNTTITANNDGSKAFAFDACTNASYEAPVVTVAEGVTVNGNVEVSATLNMNGTLNGEIVLNAATGVVNGAEVYTVTTNVDGSKVAFENGAYTVIAKTYAVKVGEAQYETLAEAIKEAEAGATITLLANIEENVTLSKNVTIDGANKTYTGTMTVNNVTATIQNVAFVKGQVYKHKSTGANAQITIKDCTFDGQGLNAYAVNVGNGKSLTFENVTAQNYGYGLLQVPSSFSSISVKNVEVSGMYYGFKVDYAVAVSMENVKIADNVTIGIYDSNYGDKTYTIKNSEISSISIWERQAAKTTTFKFEGINTVNTLTESDYAVVVAEAQSGKLYGELAGVVANANSGSTVNLLADVTLQGGNEKDAEAGLVIDKAMVIEGNGHTIDCGTFVKGIRLYNPEKITKNYRQTLQNVTIVNNNPNGRCIDTRSGSIILLLNKSTLIATNGNSQPLTIGGSEAIQAVTINASTIDAGNSGYAVINFVTPKQFISTAGRVSISGYAAFYVKADGTTLNIGQGSYTGKNIHNGASNKFGTFVLESNNNKLNISGSFPNVYAVAEGDAAQAAFLVLGENNTIKIEKSKNAGKVVLDGDNAYWAMMANTTSISDTYRDETNPQVYAEAECGGFQFVSFDEAMRFAQDGDTVKLLSDLSFTTKDCVTDCDGYSSIINVEGMALTFDLNGNDITVDAHAADLENAKSKMLLSVFSTDEGGNLTINDSEGTGKVEVKANDARVYSLVTNYTKGCSTTINGGTFVADKLYDSMIYSGATDCVTINNGNYKLENVGEGANGKPWIFNALGQNERNIDVLGGTFNAEINHQYWVFEVDVPETRALRNNGDGTWTMVDAVAYVIEPWKEWNHEVGYETLEEAIARKHKDNNTVVMVKDVDIENMITIANGDALVLDLNGKTLSATDNTTKNYSAIDNRGDLTIEDTAGEGKMTVTATVNSGWGRYSAVIANNPGGKLVVNGGTIEHLGGTDMAYGIDNLTNGKGTYAETEINGGVVKSAYIAVRQFLNGEEATNALSVNGGTLDGKYSIFFQDPSTQANSGSLYVGEEAELNASVYLGVTAGSTVWPVEVYVATAALDEESTVVSNNVPENYYVTKYDEFWTVEPKNVAELTIEDDCSKYVNYNERNVGTLTYVREFEDTEWQTIYLPFNLTYTEKIAAQFEIAYIYDAKYDETNGTTIDFVQITELGTVLFANYPYMIRAKVAGEYEIVAESTTLVATAEKSIDCSSVFETFTFTGKYNTMEANELTEPNGYFVLDGGKWEKLEEVNPFRFYMTIAMRNGEAFTYPNTTVQMRRVDENGNPSVTSVDTVEVDKDAEFIFDLQGRRVITPERGGIYIINGNKVIY